MRKTFIVALATCVVSVMAVPKVLAAPSVDPKNSVALLNAQAEATKKAGENAFAKGNLEQGRLNYLAAIELYKRADSTERKQHSGFSTRISGEIWACRMMFCDAAERFLKAKDYASAEVLVEQSIDLGNHYSTPVGPAPYVREFELLAESEIGLRKYDEALSNYKTVENISSYYYVRNEQRQWEAIKKRAEIYALMNSPKDAAAEKKRAEEFYQALHSSEEDLKAACEKGDFVTAKKLVEAGANADGDGKDSSRGWGCSLQPLHHAVLSKNKTLVAYLLDHGAKVNNQVSFVDPKNTDGLKEPVGVVPSPLHLAVYNGDVEMAHYLLSRGADVKARTIDVRIGPPLNTIGPRGECATPLHFAARGGNELMVKCLLDAHADAKALDINNKTPVDWACNLSTTALLTRPAFNFDLLLPHKM